LIEETSLVPKRYALLVGFIVVAAPFVVACMGGHDPNFHVGTDEIDAAPIDVIDASGTVECTGSDCSCPTGYACDYTCPAGSCTITCAAGSKCDIDCPGSNCTITCGEGSQCHSVCAAGCDLTCNGGSCSQECEGGPHAGCTCTGC
jgi:hypothetical protein